MPPAEMHALRRSPAVILIGAFLIAGTAAVSSWSSTLGFTTAEPFQDFRFHNRQAAEFLCGAPVTLPHPLYHWLVAATSALTGLPVSAAGLLVVLAAQIALALVAFAALAHALGDGGGRPLAAAAAAALALLLAGPLNWWTPDRKELYFGYLFPNPLHNPTVILLRPLAVALFLSCVSALDPERARGTVPARAAGMGFLTVACALAKPSFLVCLLPAVAALALPDIVRGRLRAWALLAWGLLVPGVVAVAVQTWFTLASGRMEQASVEWAPFAAVFAHTRPDAALVLFKLLMSILFPLSAVAALPREAASDRALRLAWAAFAVGALLAYGAAESGPRREHGNFLWSGHVSALVLFVASARFLAARLRTAGRGPLIACAAVLGLHVASGVRYAVAFARTGEAF
jgi:hypothetical protein